MDIFKYLLLLFFEIDFVTKLYKSQKSIVNFNCIRLLKLFNEPWTIHQTCRIICLEWALKVIIGLKVGIDRNYKCFVTMHSTPVSPGHTIRRLISRVTYRERQNIPVGPPRWVQTHGVLCFCQPHL